MSEPHDAPAALPLTVTYSPERRFGDAMHALVAKVAAAGGNTARVEPFVEALQQVVDWSLAHVAPEAGLLSLELAHRGDRLEGDMRWPRAGAPLPSADDIPALASADGLIDCSVDGDHVVCRISCPCA